MPTPRSPVVFPQVSNSRAFTLIEVVIALAIIAIALVTLFGSQARSLSLVVEAQFNNTAPLLAAGKLAQLIAADTLPFDEEGDFGPDFPGYKWQLTVESGLPEAIEMSPEAGELLHRVDLRLEGPVTDHSYTLVYYGLWRR